MQDTGHVFKASIGCIALLLVTGNQCIHSGVAVAMFWHIWGQLHKEETKNLHTAAKTAGERKRMVSRPKLLTPLELEFVVKLRRFKMGLRKQLFP